MGAGPEMGFGGFLLPSSGFGLRASWDLGVGFRRDGVEKGLVERVLQNRQETETTQCVVDEENIFKKVDRNDHELDECHKQQKKRTERHS